MNSGFLYKLQRAIEENLSFVLFRKPAEYQVWLYVQDHSGKNRVLLHSFDSQLEKSVSDSNPSFISEDDFNEDYNLNLETSRYQTAVSQEGYQNLILKTIDKIQNSGIRKIVISRKKIIENQNYNLFKTYKNLLQQHRGALVYLWHNPAEETWMGATPELLLSVSGDQVKTVSLAGTKLPENEWTQKEMEEQQIVTDFIASHFAGLRNVEIMNPMTVQAGKFQHLKTYISAEKPSDFDLNDLLNNLHPTPAVCGLPKQDAFDFIVQNEGYERGFYSGYLGIESENSKEYFVNLRCAQFFYDRIWIYVGGGITTGSDPVKEWEETELKSGTVLNSLI